MEPNVHQSWAGRAHIAGRRRGNDSDGREADTLYRAGLIAAAEIPENRVRKQKRQQREAANDQNERPDCPLHSYRSPQPWRLSPPHTRGYNTGRSRFQHRLPISSAHARP